MLTITSADGNPIEALLRVKPMTRWRASTTHLGISAAVAAAVFAFMLLVWYPKPYFEAVGAGGLILILVAVDVIIGPLITLIIFEQKKKSLRFDLTVVALLQLAALAYGIHTVFAARPVYRVFAVDRFVVVTANEVDPAMQARVKDARFKHLPLLGPEMVAADMPTDSQARNEILLASAVGADLQHFPQHYVPYAERAQQAAARAEPIANLVKRRPEAREQIDAYLHSAQRTDRSVRALPLQARRNDMIALLDATSGEVLTYLPVSPW